MGNGGELVGVILLGSEGGEGENGTVGIKGGEGETAAVALPAKGGKVGWGTDIMDIVTEVG